MPSTTWALGEYRPDLPPADNLTVCVNALPASTGYLPVGAFAAFTPPLLGLSGAGAFVASDGTTGFYAGTPTNLYRYSGVAWNSILTITAVKRWRFVQFGDNVIAVNGGAPQTTNIKSGTTGALGGSPPNADIVATIGDFVFLAGDPANILNVSWSGYNNSAQWGAGGPNQSDVQPMLDGGEVMGITGGDTSGIILQRQAIRRIVYQGGTVIFSITKVAGQVGCMAKGSVVEAGGRTFFLSERGFHYTDGSSEPVAIGFEKIDATFFARYSRQDIEKGISAAVDPRRNLVMWAMPGNPGTLWVYNYQLQRWTTISVNVSLVFSGFSSNVSIDAMDAIYGNLDAIPLSLDDPSFQGGNPLLLLVDQAGDVGTLTGASLPATFGGARMNLTAGRVRVRRARPATDAAVASLSIDGRARAADSAYTQASGAMSASGTIPIRINAQQLLPTLSISGPWSYAQGVVMEYEDGGAR